VKKLKYLINFVLVSMAVISFTLYDAQASDSTALAIDLHWENIPRKLNQDVAKQAKIPGGRLVFIKQSSLRSFDFYMDNGLHCCSYAANNTSILMECGDRTGHYFLTQSPNRNASLDWIKYPNQPGSVEPN